jgi:hypothetical protein
MVGWLTFLVSIVALTIALAQWRVARQKFVLDLFDRRFKAYNDVVSAMRPALAHSKVEHNELFDLQTAIQNAKFLFGSDVNDYLKKMWETVVRLNYWSTIYRTADPNAEKAPQGMYDCNIEIGNFFKRYPELSLPYMMMPEKRIRTPIEWFNDQNALRKNYGVEPQTLDVPR